MDAVIKKYYFDGYSYSEIRELLYKYHEYKTSVRTIIRKLKSWKLGRRNIKESPISDITAAIVKEIHSSGYNLGYRALWRKLVTKYNLTVKRNTVYRILKIADPEGISNRYGNKLRRRQYINNGSDFAWHLDGYDKLAQFGFFIHGCVCGWSRKIHWLEAATTNKDPKVVGYYFLKCVCRIGGLPNLIRSDKGVENSLIESLQICLRRNHTDKWAGEKSFIKGKSTRNQRIESYWGRMRQHSVDFYIQFFKAMREKNLFNDSNLHIKCLQYCFGPLIKNY